MKNVASAFDAWKGGREKAAVQLYISNGDVLCKGPFIAVSLKSWTYMWGGHLILFTEPRIDRRSHLGPHATSSFAKNRAIKWW